MQKSFINSWIRNFLVKKIHPKIWHQPFTFQDYIFYHRMLGTLLADAGLLPQNAADMERCMRELCKKFPRVLELGCRTAGFLSLLKDYGAQVAGTTSGAYRLHAEKVLDENSLLVECGAEDAGKHHELAGFRPDLIISLNFFDKNRWKKRVTPTKEFVNSLHRLAQPHTLCYVQPSTDNGSIIRGEEISVHRKITGFAEKMAPHELAEGPRSAVFRFKLRRRRPRK